MSVLGPQLGGQPFNHAQSPEAEEEYDRLRNLARQEHEKMVSCFDRAHQAYASGDGASAHSLSLAAKQHQAAAGDCNAQASAYIFRCNNSVDRVPSDTLDLHGQYVDEARQMLETRIVSAKASGQDHLHVIVGKGNHSAGHVRRIAPAVEEICRKEGLRYEVEENEGRIYVDLRGGEPQIPAEGLSSAGYTGVGYAGGQQQQQHDHEQAQAQAQGSFEYRNQQQQQYPIYGQPQQQQQFDQQQQQGPFTACFKACCSVM